ncbi:MAG: ThiF family adenylyltransferase [Pseudomonadota bacterium]
MTDDNRMQALLRDRARDAVRPDGLPYRSLSSDAAISTARSAGATLRQVEMAALRDDIIPERYSRNRDGLTRRDQLRLLESTVAIVGLGGLGGTVADILARAGIGRLILIDGDLFEESNLNRQLNCTVATIDSGKACAAAERIAAVNPGTETTVHSAFITSANAAALIAGADAVADCLDSLPARFVLEQAAHTLKIPMVTAAVAGAAGQVSLLQKGGPGLRTIYGDPANAPDKGVETVTGNLPFTVTAVAAIEAAEIIKTLLGRSSLAGRLLILDLDEMLFDVIDLSL